MVSNTEILNRLLNDSNVLNIYMFGSMVYGSNNEKSDNDLIVVTNNKVVSNDINIHYYTIIEFQTLLNNHEIQMLECYFLPRIFKVKEEYKFNLESIDKVKLRINISTITSNSYQKCKKKLTVMGDYDKYIAIKSLFHSLRILDFGIQIAQHGKIDNYSSMNYVMFDLLKLSAEHDYIDLWEIIETKYKKMFNNKSSIFKQLCPKTIENKTLIEHLCKVFEKHNYSNQEMFNDILNLINI